MFPSIILDGFVSSTILVMFLDIGQCHKLTVYSIVSTAIMTYSASLRSEVSKETVKENPTRQGPTAVIIKWLASSHPNMYNMDKNVRIFHLQENPFRGFVF